MPSDLTTIHPGNLDDLIHVMQRSSEGSVFQFDVDLFKFLALSRFWNFSYQHSFLSYVDGQPAGLILNAVEPALHEAYTFYWGVTPEFRGRRVGMSLFDAYLKLLREEGYTKTDGDETDGSPSSVYRRWGYTRNEDFTEMQTRKLRIPPGAEDVEIRSLDLNKLLSSWSVFEGFRHWVQRPNFLLNDRKFLQVLAAFNNDQLCGYTVFTCLPGHVVINDFRFKDDKTGLAILRRIADAGYPSPYIASFVPVASPAYRLLEEAGFVGVKHFTSTTLTFSGPGSDFGRGSASERLSSDKRDVP
jgi:GNAT superfamily N-acetyltransferase